MFGFGKKKSEIKKVKTQPKKSVAIKKKVEPKKKVAAQRKTAPRKTVATTSRTMITTAKIKYKTVSKPAKKIRVKPSIKSTATRNVGSTKPKIRAGEFATINSMSARGHKGVIGKRNKNGEITAISTTHHKYTNRLKNVPMQVNPQKDDPRKAYINKRVHRITDKNIGKRHPEMKVTNPVDKSVIRKIKTVAKKKRK